MRKQFLYKLRYCLMAMLLLWNVGVLGQSGNISINHLPDSMIERCNMVCGTNSDFIRSLKGNDSGGVVSAVNKNTKGSFSTAYAAVQDAKYKAQLQIQREELDYRKKSDEVERDFKKQKLAQEEQLEKEKIELEKGKTRANLLVELIKMGKSKAEIEEALSML